MYEEEREPALEIGRQVLKVLTQPFSLPECKRTASSRAQEVNPVIGQEREL
jgi:hypothetical protein